MKKNIFCSIIFYISIAFSIQIIIFQGLSLFGNFRISEPISFAGDSMHHLAIAKAIIEQNWWWNISRLSWPYGLPMYIFSPDGPVNYFFMFILHFFIKDPIEIINIFWFFGISFCGVTAAWSLKRLGLSNNVAFVLSIIFSFLPGIFLRNTSHLMLIPYAIPPLVTMCLLGIQGKWESQTRINKFVFFAFAGLIGLSYVYYSFFASLVVLASIIIVKIKNDKESYTNLKFLTKTFLIIIFFTFIQLIPPVAGWANDSIAKENMGKKSASEAEIYGLKIRQIITPVENHNIKLFKSITNKTKSKGYPFENENNMSKIGLIPSFGFIFLLLFSIVALTIRKQNRPKLNILFLQVNSAASLNLMLVLFCTIGGFGAIFNFFITPEIRAYNRVSPFLGFLAVYTVGLFLVYLQNNTKKIFFFNIFLFLILLFATVDQLQFKFLAQQWASDRQVFFETKNFINEIENITGGNANIYQLPDPDYPHSSYSYKMQSQENFAMYINSTNLNFSWPALSGRAINFRRKINSISDPMILPYALRSSKFDGIIIDSSGIENFSEYIKRFEKSGAFLELESRRKRFKYYNIKKLDLNKHKELQEINFSEGSTLKNYRNKDFNSAHLDLSVINCNENKLVKKNSSIFLHLKLKNNNPETLYNFEGDNKNAAKLSYAFIKKNNMNNNFEPRVNLLKSIGQNESAFFYLSIKSPSEIGPYLIEFDIVQDGTAWLSSTGLQKPACIISVVN